MRTSRLEAFSDGVLAIIITIMVLELHQPPKGADANQAALWKAAGPGMLSYLLSFVYVGIYWTNHHHMFQLTEHVTGVSLLAAAIAYYILQSVIIRSQGQDSALRKAIGRDIKGKLSPVGYIAGCAAAIVGGQPGIWIAVACYVAMAAIWFIPDRRIETVIVPAETPDPEQHG